MKYFKLLICICVFLCGFKIVQAQEIQIDLYKDVIASVKVEYIDSEYLMIPRLKPISNNKNIQIHKKLVYGNETNPLADCKFYIQKLVGKFYVNQYVEAFRQLIPNDDYDKFKTIKNDVNLTDSINLSMYLPLEPGEYRIAIEFKYYINGNQREVTSEWFDFMVLIKPRDPF